MLSILAPLLNVPTGARASAVQILPQIQPFADQITTFVRSPTWLLPFVGGDQNTYTQYEIENFETCPGALTKLRKTNEAFVNSYFSRSWPLMNSKH